METKTVPPESDIKKTEIAKRLDEVEQRVALIERELGLERQ